MGDPTVATSEKGKAMIDAAVEHLAEFRTLFREPRWDKGHAGH
jgi:creatinine amidohydrolase/Fe(II)-dependent formamide hydrolase-like protein